MPYEWNDGMSLQHHGIKGQKWGIRRYQNPDGTYTSEGKIRKREINYSEAGRKKKTSNKERRQMTTSELKKRKERLELEKKVKELERETNSTGMSWVDDALKSIGKKTLVQVGTGVAVTVAIAWLSKNGIDFSKLKTPDPKNQW